MDFVEEMESRDKAFKAGKGENRVFLDVVSLLVVLCV